MFVSGLRLVNFRSYCDAAAGFGAGLNVVVGENATGKTNLLEGAWFALRAGSPRTRREEKLITWGQRFARVEVELSDRSGGTQEASIGFAPGQGKHVRWDGLEVASLDDLRGRCQVFIFVPESLLLVKGSPARRRAHLDAYTATLDSPYASALRGSQAALKQRNAQLLAVKQGGSTAALDPWDVQFARAAVDLGKRRRALVTELSERFAAAAADLAPGGGEFSLELVTQLAAVDYDEGALVDELRARRPGETARGLSLFGPHRDDLRFLETATRRDPPAATPGEDSVYLGGAACGAEMPAGGRDLRLFGSQGEQRAAVLALLLAEQQLAAERTGQRGLLFLDDVMSELDDARRRLLIRRLSTVGQTIITTTNRHYFTDEELAEATVIELPLRGSVGDAGVAAPAEPFDAPPALDAL